MNGYIQGRAIRETKNISWERDTEVIVSIVNGIYDNTGYDRVFPLSWDTVNIIIIGMDTSLCKTFINPENPGRN